MTTAFNFTRVPNKYISGRFYLEKQMEKNSKLL